MPMTQNPCFRFLLFVISLSFAGCVGPGIAKQASVVRADIDKARKSGAYKCAPEELARAEAHTDFSESELAQGNFIRAQEHIDLAVSSIQGAMVNSSECGPKRVIIKTDLDKDNDGILDKQDFCPESPEDMDQFEDQDGCPEPDNDKDEILDPLDQCPIDAEDIDLFEDEDGCPDPDNDQDNVLDLVDECPNSPGPATNKGCPINDTDGDGINDETDACPTESEDFDGDRDEDGCPDVDADGDGIEDNVDKCPEQPEDMDTFEDTDGCPDIDNDSDGILDTVDECPLVAGPLESRGCPDEDGDGIPDKDDKCPQEVGVAQPENPEKNGCPKEYKLIVIKRDRIVIKQQVKFETAKATIKSASFNLLAEVADAIRYSSLSQVRIEGHTDNVGKDEYNMQLSQDRADSVRMYLIEKEDLDGSILEATGYGETRPISSNRTKRGRADNRRVEFHVKR